MSEDRTNQVAAQCRAVAHLATALSRVCIYYAELFAEGHMASLTEIVGRRTADQMETLGDILNGMDAVDDKEDAWMQPIFAEAQRLWPVSAVAKGQATSKPAAKVPDDGPGMNTSSTPGPK